MDFATGRASEVVGLMELGDVTPPVTPRFVRERAGPTEGTHQHLTPSSLGFLIPHHHCLSEMAQASQGPGEEEPEPEAPELSGVCSRCYDDRRHMA